MRYFFAFMITIGLFIILLFVLFSGGGSKPKTSTTANKTLISYANTDAVARMTISGPINAESQHAQSRVTVGRSTVKFEAVQGYENHVIRTATFANNESAYTSFLSALSIAGFTKGEKDSKASEIGTCPLGSRYVFEFIENGKELERYWATSCGSPRTYLGNTSLTITLFRTQVPQYNTLVSGLLL